MDLQEPERLSEGENEQTKHSKIPLHFKVTAFSKLKWNPNVGSPQVSAVASGKRLFTDNLPELWFQVCPTKCDTTATAHRTHVQSAEAVFVHRLYVHRQNQYIGLDLSDYKLKNVYFDWYIMMLTMTSSSAALLPPLVPWDWRLLLVTSLVYGWQWINCSSAFCTGSQGTREVP